MNRTGLSFTCLCTRIQLTKITVDNLLHQSFFFSFLMKISNMRKSILLLLILTIGSLAIAQNSVVLCTSYTEEGIAEGIYDQWNIKPGGGYIYIMYKQEKTIKDALTLKIDSLNTATGNYSNYATAEMAQPEGKNWVIYDMLFTQPGKYSIKVLNGKKELAVTNAEVFLVDDSSNSVDTSDGGIDTYYYENSEIVFATDVTENLEPIGQSTEFSMGNDTTVRVVVIITNDKRFATDMFYVDIYDSDENLYETFTINIDPEWDIVKFNQKFNKKGSFYVDIYNGNDIFINTGIVTIN